MVVLLTRPFAHDQPFLLNLRQAQACRDAYRKPVLIGLWLTMELAIAATDLAELIGSATALNLLFGIPIWAGVIITSLDVLLLLAWTAQRMRLLEAFIFVMVAFIAVCFAIELSTVHPSWEHVFYGFVPKPAIITDASLLYLGIGILGESHH
jgi:manganese transport protein